MINIILGKRSSLSTRLSKKLPGSLVFSQEEINDLYLHKVFSKKKKINIIINSFYPSRKLNDVKTSEFEKFCKLSIYNLSFLLSKLKNKKINKIIYTSSSSVYSVNQNLNSLIEDAYNRNLYSSFKLSSEKLIKNFCKKKQTKFYIMRIFNLYGDNKDNFSFIENIINKKKK